MAVLLQEIGNSFHPYFAIVEGKMVNSNKSKNR
jgi:hypothetical protein